jgi:hypothetical protein
MGADKDSQVEPVAELNNLPMGVYGQFTDKYSVSWIF